MEPGTEVPLGENTSYPLLRRSLISPIARCFFSISRRVLPSSERGPAIGDLGRRALILDDLKMQGVAGPLEDGIPFPQVHAGHDVQEEFPYGALRGQGTDRDLEKRVQHHQAAQVLRA